MTYTILAYLVSDTKSMANGHFSKHNPKIIIANRFVSCLQAIRGNNVCVVRRNAVTTFSNKVSFR